MECRIVLESFDEDDTGLSPVFRLRRALHLFFCSYCASEREKYTVAERIMRGNFMPGAPDITDNVMAALNLKEDIAEGSFCEKSGDFKGWIIVGCILITSLAGAFFGVDFNNVSVSGGLSFLVPFSLIAGSIITAYSALFIGAHLDALSGKFGLKPRKP